jgi:uncharacterized LabA/DUF88 family protein
LGNDSEQAFKLRAFREKVRRNFAMIQLNPLSPTNPYSNQRVGVFIDVQNMYYSARAMYDSHVNFGKILEQAISKRQLIRAIAYVIKSDAPKEQTFFDALEKVGLEIRSKDIQIFPGGEKKGDWDVGVAVDAIKIADRIDVVVLVTGDGDFTPLVTYLKENKGCRVEGIAFGRSTSSRLIESLDHFYDLDAHAKDYLIKTKH